MLTNQVVRNRFFILALLAFTLMILVGCGGMAESPSPTTPAVGNKLPILNDAIASLVAVAQSPTGTPVDASPDPEGNIIYFTVQGDGAGVYQVAASGGEITTMMQGAPLTDPLGLAVATDGQTLYVAETASDNRGLYAVPAGGGVPTLLPGTAELSPQVPELVNQNGEDQIYFSGHTPEGQAAVFKLSSSSGTPMLVFQGQPLVEPSGVAISSDGTVYVADHAASANGLASVFRITTAGAIEPIATGLTTDEELIGIALTQDEGALLVSHLEPVEKTAQVLIINLSTSEQGIFNKEIGANTGAGGLHRAHHTADFAWADSSNPGICARRPCGNVYFLEP